MNDAKVTKTDVAASNGLIHVVDRVIVPPMGEVSHVSRIDDMLAQFESKAIETRRDAAMLESKRRNRQLSWQTHTDKLSVMKEHVNEMGKMLAELEGMKPTAHAVALRVTPCLRIECKSSLGDDGWEGSSDYPAVAVHANSFEQVKTDMELAWGKHIESLLNESRSTGKQHAA